MHRILIAGKGSHHQQLARTGHIEINEETIGSSKSIGREYELVGPSVVFLQLTVRSGHMLHSTHHFRAYCTDAVLFLACVVHGIYHLLRQNNLL